MRKNKALSKYLGGDKVEIVRPMRKKIVQLQAAHYLNEKFDYKTEEGRSTQ